MPGFREWKSLNTPVSQLELQLLSDVLKRYQATAFLDIELKVPGLETATLDLLRSCKPRRGYVISSFLPEVLQTVHSLDANALAGADLRDARPVRPLALAAC